ncbi:hypothetical protein SPRG_09941 [Saprolegnia parasitica CBS 223.65]|uniref:Uncharacterized protein n=1 Tax=Saprolegnia parasitica (strain CBS 223.65) TaxID=695850 RepID=A0A067BXY2_SAPPC|nr:hypothetical protein SPRG_09941 [Saprolegnia parasitica CBS 223.65]KDO23133.1 hypothetical protein SPRG_09941 [Saprolegnia parasitica CBS 223.65]|eukprot:XP_012206085.1 hypothetical protein SPRG_09941 [Saprolegnia parasitica CBS 223.65]
MERPPCRFASHCGPPTATLVDGPSSVSSFTDPSRKSDSVRLGSRLSGTPACDTRTSSIDDDASLELLASRNQSFYTVDLLLDGDGKTLTSARRHADATSRRIMRPDQYVVVSPAVLTEIRRRRTNRRRLLEALRHAQKVHRDTKLMLASKKELTDALANVTVSYRSATESAIIDYVKVGLDPDLHTFFTSVVKPVLTPSDHKVHEKRRSVLWLPPPT